MSPERYTLAPAAGVSTGIGFYLSGMDEVRAQLREALEGMSDEQLARRAVDGAHAIGALALHCVAAEWLWMRRTTDGSELTDEDRRTAHMNVLEDPDAFAAKGYTAEYCLNALDAVREQTRERLASFSDGDLDHLYSFVRQGRTFEVSLRWTLHHLIDHEAQHKGQILMLKRLLSSSS
jgi:uncharacterized damage-inducible protein DinB